MTLDLMSRVWSLDHPDYIRNVRDVFVRLEDSIYYRYVRTSDYLRLFQSYTGIKDIALRLATYDQAT